MATQLSQAKSPTELVISWEALPKDFKLEDEPVENTGQPLLAGALRESLEISGFIQPQMLIRHLRKKFSYLKFIYKYHGN